MKLWVTSACSLLLIFSSVVVCAQDVQPIRIPAPRSTYDTAHIYATGLLKKALQKAANGREVPLLEPSTIMSTERKIHELRLNRTLDVFWLGGSKARARDLLVVPIPLERGLMGYRQFIIRKDRIADFNAVHTLKDLTELKACMDRHWMRIFFRMQIYL